MKADRECPTCGLLREALDIERARVDRLLPDLRAVALAAPPGAIVSPDGDTIEGLDVPPDAVMAAMKRISPRQDATYEANYRYWEANKERAKLYPKEFAEEILTGETFAVQGL